MSDSAGSVFTSSKLTYEDYVTLPDDGRRYEILDGELAMTPSPPVRHQRVSANLYPQLVRHVNERQAGLLLYAPVDVILDRFTVVVPDLVYVSKERRSIVTERAIEGAPDLIVEILSPGTTRRDRGVKLKLYARFAVPHYWIVDPARCVLELRQRTARGYRLVANHRGVARCTTPLFPELTLDLAELWA